MGIKVRVRRFTGLAAIVFIGSLVTTLPVAPAHALAPSATSDPHRPCLDSSSFTDASLRIDNLRLERITSGTMRDRVVVAGRLDHAHADFTQGVRLRMTVREARGVIARRIWDYQLPAGVAPQDMVLRMLLTRSQTQAVDDAGRTATVVVDVWQSAEPSGSALAGHRHSAIARRLCERPMPSL